MFLAFGWGCLIWQPLAQKFGKRPVYLFTLLGSMWFTHERGTYMGFYALFLVGSNFLAPVIAGFINDGQGWEWVLYWCAIFCGAVGYTPSSLEKGLKETSDSDKVAPILSAKGPVMGPASKKSYLDKIKVFRQTDINHEASLVEMLIRPFLYFSFPSIVFAGFMYGAVVCYFNVLNGTASLVLSSLPYNFRASIVGLSYVSCLIGVGIGTVYSGLFGDRFVIWKARRNKGIVEPESRLWLFTALLICVPGALLLWGVGAAHEVHWFGLVFSMGVFGAAITAGSQLSISYCIDCYKELGEDAIVTVILIRNTMSFAVSYGITPWVENMGYQNAFLVAAFSALAQISSYFAIIK
ncbi:major facilitator superfamily transporter [Colletotrichum incanum]|nr:major facilitator superfamily transporter [Colletotrichum incanum]